MVLAEHLNDRDHCESINLVGKIKALQRNGMGEWIEF
jgi:hypothetical protein